MESSAYACLIILFTEHSSCRCKEKDLLSVMSLTEIQLAGYLKRINYSGRLVPQKEVLFKLHERHTLTIPFENIEVINQKAISLNLNDIYDKMIIEKWGGYCFELNELFAVLLESIGFKVIRLYARVLRNDFAVAPPNIRQFLLVKLDDDCYICDVGLIFLWVEFPAACRDHMKDERIYTQKPQRDGTALPFGISSKVPSVDI